VKFLPRYLLFYPGIWIYRVTVHAFLLLVLAWSFYVNPRLHFATHFGYSTDGACNRRRCQELG